MRRAFIGEQGRGTPFRAGVADKVEILTGTFGKALGGAMGGYVAAGQPIIDLLRQRARPYLFSNSLAPPVAAGSIKAIEIAERGDDLAHAPFRQHKALPRRPQGGRLRALARRDADHSRDAARCAAGAGDGAALDERGVYVAGFFFPVVPKGRARIRTQMSAALSEADIDLAVDAFVDAGKSLGVV